MAAIIGLVVSAYLKRVQTRSQTAPKTPSILPDDTASTAKDWEWKQTANGKPTVEVKAKDFRQVREPNQFELKGVELHLYNKEATSYDLVKSAEAQFDISTGMLYSEGAVEITMNVPAEGAPDSRLMVIKSSGVHFETKTGKATTDREVSFEFDRGGGTGKGAQYDPQTHELHLASEADLTWRGTNPKAPPMHIETGELTYKEAESKVYLAPWAKMTRDTLRMDGGATVVTLTKGAISLVESDGAHGVNQQETRTMDFAADHMAMNFADGQVSQITGQPNGRLISTSKSGKTTIATDRIEMNFEVEKKGEHGESKLKEAVANGHGVVVSEPAAGAANPETRTLKSEIIHMKMRAGGEEIESVETEAASTLEFTPNGPGRPRRLVTGERIWIAYGAGNQIESFRAVNVTTKTQNPKLAGAKVAPPAAMTWSKDMTAAFEPKTNQVAKVEQWGDFRYQAGDRQAKAEKAELDQSRNRMTLTGQARIWDATGSTAADRIVLDEKNSDFTADGGVNSVRMPDKNGDSSGMLSADQPLHAKAEHMQSRNHDEQIVYKGGAVAWQEANRLQAPEIAIDREESRLEAHGGVTSELLDKKSTAGSGKTSGQGPVFTVVKAQDMVYTDDDHLARYTGGVKLTRPGLSVTGNEVDAYLRETESGGDAKTGAKGDTGSSLDRALAKGKVEIISTGAARKRVGTAERAQYFVDDGKVVLEEGRPQLVDSLKGTTKGSELTWFANNDRLLVNGVEKQPASSLLLRK